MGKVTTGTDHYEVDRIETDSVPLPALALIYTYSTRETFQFTYMSAEQKLIYFTFIYFTKKKDILRGCQLTKS